MLPRKKSGQIEGGNLDTSRRGRLRRRGEGEGYEAERDKKGEREGQGQGYVQGRDTGRE